MRFRRFRHRKSLQKSLQVQIRVEHLDSGDIQGCGKPFKFEACSVQSVQSQAYPKEIFQKVVELLAPDCSGPVSVCTPCSACYSLLDSA